MSRTLPTCDHCGCEIRAVAAEVTVERGVTFGFTCECNTVYTGGEVPRKWLSPEEKDVPLGGGR